MREKVVGIARRFSRSIFYRNHLSCYWCKGANWGDALTPYLLSKMTARKVRFEGNPNCRRYSVIGSILQRAGKYTTVWGSGMISGEALPKQAPSRICAVRGPLTRRMLRESGIECPEVYGDPALLLPRFYSPPKTIGYRLGVIPHMVDKEHPWIKKVSSSDDVNLIDIEDDIENFVKEVLSCETILSSSLHGLICADSFGIPNRRMVLSNQIVGGDFKFLDYYGAANVDPQSPLEPSSSDSLLSILPGIDRVSKTPDLDLLMRECPFPEVNPQP